MIVIVTEASHVDLNVSVSLICDCDATSPTHDCDAASQVVWEQVERGGGERLREPQQPQRPQPLP